jgi:hypothetical protein
MFPKRKFKSNQFSETFCKIYFLLLSPPTIIPENARGAEKVGGKGRRQGAVLPPALKRHPPLGGGRRASHGREAILERARLESRTSEGGDEVKTFLGKRAGRPRSGRGGYSFATIFP